MRRRTRLGVLVVAALLLLASCSDGEPDAAVTVGLFKITSATVADAVVDGFTTGFLQRTGLATDEVRFVEENAQGDGTVIQSIARRFADSDVDIIAVVGTPAVIAQAAVVRDRPVIALAMGDPVGAGLASSLDAPGGNVTGSIDYIDPARVVDAVRTVHPELRRIGTVYDPSNQNSQVWITDLRTILPARGLILAEATIATSADLQTAARSLVGRAELILVGPDATVAAGLPAVGQVAADHRLPLYATTADVTTPGLVATLGPDYAALGRQAGAAAAEVYAGTPPGDVPFRRPEGLVWQLNTETVDGLGLTIPAEVLAQVPPAR